MASVLVVIVIVSLLFPPLASQTSEPITFEHCFSSANCRVHGTDVIPCNESCAEAQILRPVQKSANQTYFVTRARDSVAAFEMAAYRVKEGEDTTLCINIYNRSMVRVVAYLIESNISVTISINATQKPAPDISNAVNRKFMLTSVTLEHDDAGKSQCTNITIPNDMMVEKDEIFDLILTVKPPTGMMVNVDPNLSHAKLEILDDDDAAKVGLENTSYTVSEDDDVVEVCAIVDSPYIVAFSFDVHLSIVDDSAVIPKDYFFQSTVLTFRECQNRSCVNISIVDDSLVENDNESFNVTLKRIQAPYQDGRITFNNQTVGVINIKDNEAIVVLLEHPCYQVFENDDKVEVCAIINSSLECPVSFPFEVFLTTSDGTADANSDYNMSINSARFKECQKKSCVNVSIMDDKTVEMRMESFNISLEMRMESCNISLGMPSDERIKLNTQETTIIIYDDDMAQVRLDYLNEIVNGVEVCALLGDNQDGLECPAKFPVIISLSIYDTTAVTTLNNYYSALLMFDECDTRNCVNVSIEDDLVVEMTESITVTLGIIDIPGQGNIIPDSDNVKDFINITDDDVAVVGLEKTLYYVPEDDDMVEVCTIVYSPKIDYPVAFPFDVLILLSTGDDRTESSTNFTMTFEDGGKRNCVNISIVNDAELDVTTTFKVTLKRTSTDDDLNRKITLNPVNAVIAKNNDMCPDLVDPEGGRLVILTRKSVGGTAGFICNFGYELVGAATLTCQANGMWSAPPPVCMSAGAYVLYMEQKDGSVFAELVVTGEHDLNQGILVNFCIQNNSKSPLNFSMDSSPAPHGSHNGNCIKAGFSTCCSGNGEDCKVAGENCYCDALCHFYNDCCGDIQDICPAYWEEIFSAEPGNEITVNISTENALVFVKEETEKFTT